VSNVEEEVKISAVKKFDLANLELELGGLLDKLTGDLDALSCFHDILSNALLNCKQAIAQAERSDEHKSTANN
jgi:hypothetical protein